MSSPELEYVKVMAAVPAVLTAVALFLVLSARLIGMLVEAGPRGSLVIGAVGAVGVGGGSVAYLLWGDLGVFWYMLTILWGGGLLTLWGGSCSACDEWGGFQQEDRPRLLSVGEVEALGPLALAALVVKRTCALGPGLGAWVVSLALYLGVAAWVYDRSRIRGKGEWIEETTFLLFLLSILVGLIIRGLNVMVARERRGEGRGIGVTVPKSVRKLLPTAFWWLIVLPLMCSFALFAFIKVLE